MNLRKKICEGRRRKQQCKGWAGLEERDWGWLRLKHMISMHEILHKDKIADTCALHLSVFITNKYNKLLLTLDVTKQESYSGHFSTMLRTLQWLEEPQREASVYSLSLGVLSLIHVLFSLA